MDMMTCPTPLSVPSGRRRGGVAPLLSKSASTMSTQIDFAARHKKMVLHHANRINVACRIAPTPARSRQSWYMPSIVSERDVDAAPDLERANPASKERAECPGRLPVSPRSLDHGGARWAIQGLKRGLEGQ